MIVKWLEDLPRPIIGWRNPRNAMLVAASREKSKQRDLALTLFRQVQKFNYSSSILRDNGMCEECFSGTEKKY